MTLRPLFARLAALILAAAPAPALAAAAPAGVWLWDTGDAAVEFHPCGAELCARIIWLKAEAAPDAPIARDARNPDPGERTRRLCGIDYITGLKPTKAGEWRGGRVYDFISGKTYDLDIDSFDAASVKMRGYQGVRLLGATLKLVRAPDPAPACKPAP